MMCIWWRLGVCFSFLEDFCFVLLDGNGEGGSLERKERGSLEGCAKEFLVQDGCSLLWSHTLSRQLIRIRKEYTMTSS
ncbi:hypothetical protein BO78DRAFT_331058 [Aspergillus sclerotiicarbonarius CBS 121057]|uniref:Secreted protein n=1 Tax=Aspergillus sclerotiicarbonarius (strain CBS 121057 / IBT 28362) TaxID=1448318 RepID=A0A319EQ03_ASPSB|nr:hypothetical protein BO78DRAFT_331058 [Aspergillus sclerotiicarbonarius CBS 121057]